MAIEFTKSSDPKHLIFEKLEFNIRRKQIRLLFIDEDGEDHQFQTAPEKWNAALTFLFKDLANAAELKDRIETYLVNNKIIGGTIVPD